MIARAVRVAALTTVYLMFLASVQPGDVLVGVLLAVLLVLAEAWVFGPDRRPSRLAARIALGRLAGLPALVGFTAMDVCRGSWQVAACCLGLRPLAPGVVRLQIRPNSATSATAWAIRVGISPNTVPVDIDCEQGTLLVHVLDARDPDAVIRTQTASYERAQRRAFP